jgi:AAA domain-containing protein
MMAEVKTRVLAGSVASEWAPQTRETVTVAGEPKGAGKTTFAISAIHGDRRGVVVACDLGKLSIPPAVKRENVLVVSYQELTREIKEGHSSPVRDVYLKLTGDLYEIYRSVKDQRAIQLPDGKEFAPPDVVVLDGMSRLNNMLVDGQCALNNIADPSDLDNKAYKFWGKRLRDVLTIVEQFASLPCDVVMTSWVDEQKNSDGTGTGVFYPDVGGKMDKLTPGETSNALYGFSRQGKFFVKVKADGKHPWIGLRSNYNIPASGEIDVTITGAAGELTPWQKCFGK